MIRYVPVASLGAIVLNGHRNGVISVGIYNVESFRSNNFFPSFNVERTSFSKIIGESIEDRFYYDDGKTGDRVYVD